MKSTARSARSRSRSSPRSDTSNGIADTADATVARLGAVVGTLESVAGGVGNTAKLATDAVTPALVNLGATLSGDHRRPAPARHRPPRGTTTASDGVQRRAGAERG